MAISRQYGKARFKWPTRGCRANSTWPEVAFLGDYWRVTAQALVITSGRAGRREKADFRLLITIIGSQAALLVEGSSGALRESVSHR
jgi:hypothetical protein